MNYFQKYKYNILEYYEDINNVRLTIDNKIKFWKSLDNQKMFYGNSLSYELNIAEIKFSPDLYGYVSKLLNYTRFIPKGILNIL